MFDFSAEAGLWGLLISAFVSATILPGNSEIVLIAVLAKHPEAFWSAIAVATLGNTLGGVTSYWLGRLIPDKADNRALNWLRRYGSSLLLLSWVPLAGDAICVAAGWLRLPAWRSALLLAVGKLARYVIIAGGWAWFAATLIQ